MSPDDATSVKARAEVAQFARFLAFGGCVAAVNWLSRFPLEYLIGFPAAVAAAHMIGMVVGFTLFRLYVFPLSAQAYERQVKFFVLVSLAGFAQIWAVSMALVYYLFPALGIIDPLAEPLGHGIAIGVPTISGYLGHRFLTFKSN